MCEQTKAYDDGDIVWVKLSTCWWPGEVYEESRLPADLVASLKKPLAVVKFFQEDSYEYVKNINNIFKYQCSRKSEFIRKGMDLHKSKRKYMENFPADVETAEKRTGGDVNIVRKMQVSPQKSSPSVWTDVFGDTSPKKGKPLSPLKKGRKPLKSPRKSTPPLTKTFLAKERVHEVRILGSASSAPRTSTDSTPGLYKCHACPFSCNRINVIVLHSKTHTADPTVKTPPKTKPKRATPKIEVTPEVPSEDEAPKVVARKPPRTRTPVAKPPKKRGKRKLSEVEEAPQEKVEAPSVPEVKQPVKKRKTDLEWKNELLADWSEDDEPLSESNFSQEIPAEKTPPETKIPPVEEKKEEPKTTPIKYRNIPKKDRRDIVLESGELMEVNRPSISAPTPPEAPAPQDLAKSEPSAETSGAKRRSSRRKTKISVSEDEEALRAKSPKKDIQPKESDAEADAAKSISCFDFPEDEEEVVLDSITKHRQKKLSDGTRKSWEASREADDKLNSDIESLLKATILPRIPDTPRTAEGTREIALPPKERGKRIFKSKNRSKSNSLEMDDDKKSPRSKLRESTDDAHSPTKEPTESDLQIAQTLINLPDHTPPLPTIKTNSTMKRDFDFGDCKETNAAEVLMNLGNLTETRSPTKQQEKVPKYGTAGKSAAEAKIKIPDNISVTKVVKSPQTSPNHTKKFTEVPLSDTEAERVKLKKVVPKKRKPNIDVVEEIIVERVQRTTESTVVTVPPPAVSPKKIIKLKSQMRSPTKEDNTVFDISNMPIVLTDDVANVDKYSVIDSTKSIATSSKVSTTTSNGRELGRVTKVPKRREEVVISKSALVKRVKLLESQKERSGSSSPDVSHHKDERRLIKLPPKKVKDTTDGKPNLSVGSTVVLVPKRQSPTKIIYSSSTVVPTTSTMNPPITLKISKSQVIQGKSGGQIVITSKGKVITKQSDLITTTASKVPEVSTTYKLSEGTKMAAHPTKLIIKSPAKIHVQSQEIIYKPPKETTTKPTAYEKIQEDARKDAESQKKAMRRIKRPRRLEIVETATHSGTNTQTIVVQEVPPLAPITTETLTSNCVKNTPTDETASLRLKAAPKSPVKSNKQTDKIIVEGGSVKTATSPDVTIATREKSDKVTMAADCSSTTNPESTSNIQDSQLLAIPGESFGGPPNSFFLCTLDNGTFTPIDNQPLYLDASNQLVPHPPEVVESDADVQDAIVEVQEGGEQQIVVEGGDAAEEAKYVLSTGNGQQILLDQQSLLAIAAGDMPRLVTPEGQELILQGSSQDILSSITLNQGELGILTDGQQIIVPEGMANSPNQDILAAALAGTEVFAQDNLIADVPQIPAANPAQVSETNAVLTKPPIMSTLEVPTKTDNIAPNVSLEAGFPAQNLDESLAVIGVKGNSTKVPTSLELPITVTNPAIAAKTTKSPLSLTSIYLPPVKTTSSQISPSIPIVEEIFAATNNVLELYHATSDEAKDLSAEVEVETTDKEIYVPLDDIIEETTVESENAGEVDSINGNDIVPVTPESLTNHDENIPFNDDDGNSSNSSEIPIQPDLILRPEDFDGQECESHVATSEMSDILENLTTNSITCVVSVNQNSPQGHQNRSEDMS